jgi:hypothetical protein
MPPSAARSHLPRTPSKPDTQFPRRTLLGDSLNKPGHPGQKPISSIVLITYVQPLCVGIGSNY